jgi:hypothetical protein
MKWRKYDIPASIDYVLNATGHEKLAAYLDIR